MTEDILLRLLGARLPCDCVNKAAEHQLHEESCLYRLVREGVAEIERLRAENRRLQPSTPARPYSPYSDVGCWVRLMCYFGTDGVWNSDDAAVDIAALPFSQRLRDEIIDWRSSRAASAAEIESFSARALTLARHIKSELPHWKVIYVDRTRSGPDIRSKDIIEIEVTA